jgi:alanine dehydrogenase
MKILLIPKKDIEGILSMREVMNAVESAFRYKALGKVQMPPKLYVMFPKGDFRTCPVTSLSLDLVGLRLLMSIQRIQRNMGYLP